MIQPVRKSPLSRTPRRQFPLNQIEQGHYTLQILGSLRFATNNQIERAIFVRTSQSPHQARHRSTRALRRLFDAGYINRTPVLAPSSRSTSLSRQIVSSLSPLGARSIGLDPDLLRRRSPKPGQVLGHDFWLVDIGVEAIGGCTDGLNVVCWWDERVLRSRKRKGQLRLSGIPDAYLLVQNVQTGKLFPTLLELDLGTESVVGTQGRRLTVSSKVEEYRDYLEQTFREDFGIDAPAVVLWLTNSERRCQSMRQAAYTTGARGRFWFSTMNMARGISKPQSDLGTPSEALERPFWTFIWQTANRDEWRSLARRCGISREDSAL